VILEKLWDKTIYKLITLNHKKTWLLLSMQVQTQNMTKTSCNHSKSQVVTTFYSIKHLNNI